MLRAAVVWQKLAGMRDFRSLRGFTSGVLVGILVGSAGVSVAAIGYKGWSKFSPDFRAGYAAGFVDMSNLARNLDPGGYIDTNYPYIVGARAHDWSALVDELYKKPEYQGHTITSMMQLATKILEERFGKTSPPEARTARKMQLQLEALRQKREEMGLPPDEGKSTVTEAPAKSVEPAKPAVRPAPKPRKWCRCDGKDPKVARAERRAAAQAARKSKEGAENPAEGAGAAGNADSSSKTPPNAPATK